MATTNKQALSAGKTVKKLLCAAVLASASVAQAGVLNFEGEVDSPFIFSGEQVKFGNYWVESYGGSLSGDLVGAIVDGSDSTCMFTGCPSNNKSQYYAGLDDGYFYFGLNDDSPFRLKSLKASYINADRASVPALAGLLVLQGYNALGQAVGGSLQVPLAGPDSLGQYAFRTFDLTALGSYYSFVRVLGYGCDASGACNRNSNLANFAIDDIETIPEPGTLALFGLGLAGLGFASRRRRAR